MEATMRRAQLGVVLSALALVAATADAAPVLLVDPSGVLRGASGVVVAGSLYDVEFVEGTCAQVFGACDPAHFTFTTQIDALAASQALLDQVLLDGPAGAFDSNPTLTYGCTFESNCFLFTPYGTSGRGVGSDGNIYNGFLIPAEVVNINVGADIAAQVACVPCFPLTDSLDDTFYDSLIDSNGTFARWTAVPEPSALLLLSAGLATATVRKHRKS
jgi:hypothetical protein